MSVSGNNWFSLFYHDALGGGSGGGTTQGGSANWKFKPFTDPESPAFTLEADLERFIIKPDFTMELDVTHIAMNLDVEAALMLLSTEIDANLKTFVEYGLEQSRTNVQAETSQNFTLDMELPLSATIKPDINLDFTLAVDADLFMDTDMDLGVINVTFDLTVLADKDTFVEESVLTNPVHDGEDLEFDGLLTAVKRAWIGFDLTQFPTGSTVQLAELILQWKTSLLGLGGLFGSLTLYRIADGDEGWDETTMHDANDPDLGAVLQQTGMGTGATEQVISLNQSWLTRFEESIDAGNTATIVIANENLVSLAKTAESKDEGTDDHLGPRLHVRISTFGGFTPNNLANLRAWYDAADLSADPDAIPADGGTVTEWHSIGPTAERDLANGTLANEPTYNVANPQYRGKPTVHFVAGDFIEGNHPSEGQPNVVYAVLNHNDSAAGIQNMINAESNNNAMIRYDGNNEEWSVFVNGSGGGTITSTEAIGTAPVIIGVGMTATSNDWLRINGVESSGTLGTFGWDGFRLGNNSSGGGNSRCDIAEIVFVDGDITNVERAKLELYFKNKYGIGEFTPSNLEPDMWFRADTIQVEDGDAVTQWDDSTGNGNNLTQAVPVNQPTFETARFDLNNKPAIRCNPNTNPQFLRGTTSTHSQPVTIAWVARGNGTGARIVTEGDLNNNDSIETGFTSGTQLRTRAGTTVSSSIIDNSNEGNFYIGVIDGASTTIYGKNGSHTGDTGSNDFLGLTIGAGHTANPTSSPFNGWIAEVIVVGRAITADEITGLETYFRNRYDIT